METGCRGQSPWEVHMRQENNMSNTKRSPPSAVDLMAVHNKTWHKVEANAFDYNVDVVKMYRVGQINPHNYFHAVQAWISQGIREAMV